MLYHFKNVIRFEIENGTHVNTIKKIIKNTIYRHVPTYLILLKSKLKIIALQFVDF